MYASRDTNAADVGGDTYQHRQMSSNAHMIRCQAAFDIIYIVQGLAYSVSGGWNTTPADHVGLFVAGGETAKPVEFLAALQRLLQVCAGPMVINSTCQPHMTSPFFLQLWIIAATPRTAIRLSMSTWQKAW